MAPYDRFLSAPEVGRSEMWPLQVFCNS